MSNLGPAASRVHVEETSSGLVVVLPGRRRWGQLVTGGLALGAFLAVGVFFALEYPDILRALLREAGGRWGGALRTVCWQALGILGGAAGCVVALAGWVQTVAGREYWHVDSEGLTRSWRPIALPRPRRYLAANMAGLRTVPSEPDWQHEIWDVRWWTGMSPTIAFDYGAGTVYLGAKLDGAEAREVVAAILRRFPGLGERKEPTA